MNEETIKNMTDEEKKELKNKVLEVWERIKKALKRVIKAVIDEFKTFIKNNESLLKRMIVMSKAQSLYRENKPIQSIKIKGYKKVKWNLLN